MIRYPVTIFLSAFLLFQVQPLIGKLILPWFGGTPAVWTACMLFFQILLLGGYSYAHLVTSRLPARPLAAVHGVLLLASLVFLPVQLGEGWKPTGEEIPLLQILGLLLATIGLPYFLLSTTGPLLQASFHRETGHTPYRLYALSNIGSLLALLTYPFVFEPQLTLRVQRLAWSGGYALFVALGLWSAVALLRFWQPAHTPEPDLAEPDAERPAASRILLWLALAACGSLMLLATTNQLCQEVTSVPFLWVLPLSLYLFTFIICFDHERWYHRSTFLVLLAVAVALAAYALVEGAGMGIYQQLAIYSLTLFVCCMVCHGELVLTKPAPRYATLFYLMVSAGGALGGVLVAVVAPLVFNGYWEYPLGLVATIGLAFLATLKHSEKKIIIPRSAWVVAGGVVLLVSLSVGLVLGRTAQIESTLAASRNFYGVLRVHRNSGYDRLEPRDRLLNGTIEHGTQFLDDDKRDWPTTYYGHDSGVGLAIEHHPRAAEGPLRIGVIGLGCGTLAAYGREGDTIRFYEINPEVIRISDEYFTYRKDSPAEIDVALGDARITLENELADGQGQQFDVLVIDAFSSDSIPMHLLTKEAVALYLEHLKPDGILCIHVSNHYLELESVVLGIVRELGWACVTIDTSGVESRGTNGATWVLVTRNWEFLGDPVVSQASRSTLPKTGPIVWTDDYGSLWQVMR
ncbi:MAG: hypothetical protein DWQ37_12800 [Planctomycetota bacterium]|nr:MAG: hypothetical protein DWQ37_12800 [Planctomycetota bacterium]